MIKLDRAQSFALHRATTESVVAYGSGGTGKSSLANAIAVQAAGAGLTCLLVGSGSRLDKPLIYTVAGICHPILARRAQVNTGRPVVDSISIPLWPAGGSIRPPCREL